MRSDATTGVVLWARSELRRRWHSLLLLGVLAGVAAGLAIASVDGAARTKTSYQRMRDRYDAADAVFFPSQVFANADPAKLATIPEVAAWGGFASTESAIDEFPGEGGPLIMVGDDWFRSVEGAKLIAGRLPDPSRDDEAVVNVPALKVGATLGAVLTWRNLSPADVQRLHGYPQSDFDWHRATGPVTKLTIVGVIRQPMESVLSFASSPLLWAGPGWAKAHLQDCVVDFVNAVVRLRHGAAGVPTFAAALPAVYGRDDLPVKDLSDDIKRVQRSLDVERGALLLFAVTVVLATAVLIGQAFGRSVRSVSDGLPALRALGLDRFSLLRGLVAPHVVTFVATALTTIGASIVWSGRFPIGLGRRLDPSLGVHVDVRSLAIGTAITLVLAVLACGLAAWRAVIRLAPRHETPRTQVLGAATRAGAPVPIAVGTSMAFERPPLRSGVTGRPALAAAIVGILGVVGAVTLVHGIDDVLGEPERVGETWQVEATPLVDTSSSDAVAAARNMIAGTTQQIAGLADVDAFSSAWRAPIVVEGKGDVPVYSIEPLKGSVEYTLLKGRAPTADTEIALGPRTASLVHAGIGDIITVGTDARPMKVVGITLLRQTPHTSFDEGGWITQQAFDDITPLAAREPLVLVRLRHGASVDAGVQALNELGYYSLPPAQPPDVANLENVRNLPLLLAAFIVVLALGAAAHALLTGARARARELAVLRALGLTPRQAAGCVTWQAAIMGIVASAIGVPLGVIAGRQVWRVLADSLSFVYVGPVAFEVILVIVPAALVVLAMLAVWPARGAARLRTAEVLRSE